jgi:hypothetical protein
MRKHLTIFIAAPLAMAFCVLFGMASLCHACENQPECKQTQMNAQLQKQSQHQSQAAVATSKATSVNATNVKVASNPTSNAGAVSSSGPSSSSVGDIHFDGRTTEHVQFAPVDSATVRIGEASKPVPQVYVQGQAEDDQFDGRRTNAFQVGVAIPITWGTGINGALAGESQRLKDQRLHERERHQAEMAEICMALHKYIMSTSEDLSPELWNRCAGFEHFNNRRTNDMMGRHNGEMNPRQYSPHHIEYHP